MVGHPAQRSSAPLYRTLGASALIVAIIVSGGCADALNPVSPAAEPAELRQSSLVRRSSSGAQTGLLECPTNLTRSVSSNIGPFGGMLELDGVSMIVPPGAVLLPTLFTLTVPASKYVEIDVTAAGFEKFEFLHPVSMTISYARCMRRDIDQRVLRAWHIDPVTKELLEDMNGTDDKSARTVTFGTGHLSGYSIGYGTEPPPDDEN